jgi:anthranilate phosphoribosyltransferase
MNLQNLTAQNFEEIFSNIIEQKISEQKTKEFLLNLNENGYSKESFFGAVTALKKRMKKISAPKNAIDVCGTGGDKLNTLNISTAVCFVIAAAGISVAKHGNKAVSSTSGSADIFSELGIKISSDAAEIEKTLHEKNLCFLFAPFFHESLKNLAQIRKEFALEFSQPTIFNYLGPLLNPANTNFQLIGTSKKETMRIMLEVAAKKSFINEIDTQNFSQFKNEDEKIIYIVHGFDGMDEITLCNNSYLLRFENNKLYEEEIINPEKFGFKKVGIESLKGKNPKYNAQKLIALLEGEKSAYRDIVILNTAYAFKVAQKVSKIEEGVELAKEMIDSYKAKKVLTEICN